MKTEEKEFIKTNKQINNIFNSAKETSYYNKIFSDIGILNSKCITYEEFLKIPILTKKTYQENISKMINPKIGFDHDFYITNCKDYNSKRHYLDELGLCLKITSGTTGQPLEIIKSKKDVFCDYMNLNKHRIVNKFNITGKFMWIWPVNPIIRNAFYKNQTTDKIISINEHGYQYMLYEYSNENFKVLYDFISDNNIKWITSSPSAIIGLANYITKNNKKNIELDYIECHSEHLHDWQQKIINKTFGINAYSIYSSNEIQFIAGTNDEDFTLIKNNVFFEIINNKVIVTSLSNVDIPIIRYELGDVAEWIDDNKLKFKLKEYRIYDFILKENGDKIEPNIIFDLIILLKNKFNLTLERYKVSQIEYDRFVFSFPQYIKIKEKQLEPFIINYLTQLLNKDITIEFIFEDSSYNTDKHKYFEVSSKLKGEKNE